VFGGVKDAGRVFKMTTGERPTGREKEEGPIEKDRTEAKSLALTLTPGNPPIERPWWDMTGKGGARTVEWGKKEGIVQ